VVSNLFWYLWCQGFQSAIIKRKINYSRTTPGTEMISVPQMYMSYSSHVSTRMYMSNACRMRVMYMSDACRRTKQASKQMYVNCGHALISIIYTHIFMN